MKLIITFFTLFFIGVHAQSDYGVIQDPNYKKVLDENLTYYAIQSSSTSQGYVYFYATSKYGAGFYLRKILPTGYNDTSFGNNGISTSVLPLVWNSTTKYPEGSILTNDQAIFLYNKNVIAKYDVNGNLDTSFGVGGYVTFTENIGRLSLNGDSTLMIQINGMLKKLTLNGQLDSNFSTIPVYVYYLTDSGIIVKTSGVNDEYKKYDLTGIQDMTFGTSGIANIPGIIKTNRHTGEMFLYSYHFPVEIKKYTANGFLDTSFGTAGVATYSFPANPNVYYPPANSTTVGIQMDSNNNIYVFGGSEAGIDYQKTAYILRFTPNGILDNSFNNGNSLFYRQSAPSIVSMSILDDNKYLCFNTLRQGAMNYVTGTTQYVRQLGALSTHEFRKENSYLVHPNPVKDVFNIRLDSNEKLEYAELFDISGKLLKKISSVKIDISDLNTGAYFLKTKTDRNSYHTKLIKK
ncbi:uncharacterized protein CHSO_1721 [Chryseobacterium sp. StRB126]|uniref:T9SS type A sorting domain-containing protein n=1 Tax=Chryseobacterium sp. StRB126 TaxID=878220 RepID=UPI0004E9865B|nr:T9SS type A sorting domain-containing protein [Chryseobacterium sp. StRB126]BAP30758.1 uncharacterized protein CHSO_1721 [Chryseobacterium sp. StRB126]